MATKDYTDDELERYFSDATARRAGASASTTTAPGEPKTGRPSDAEIQRRAKKLLKSLALVVGVVALIGLITLLALLPTLPPLTAIENPETQEATVAYTSDGVELARYYAGENRTWVGQAEISPWVYKALVAQEDRRFYEHWGVDLRGIMAALGDIVLKGDLRGASTLSQQLARNLYREIGFENSLTRKLKEALTAVQIERNYTKDEILVMYLNTVPFGNNAFGIEAGAQTYFGKSALELEVEEAAVLVGMLAATTAYNPARNPERSRQRRNVVLGSMLRAGEISREEFDALRDEPIVLDFKPYSHTTNLAPHFAEVLRMWLREWAKENGYDLYGDGLVVHTTLDSRLQKMAQQAVDVQVGKLQTIVNVEWGTGFRSRYEDKYVEYAANNDFEPFGTFWRTQTRLVDAFVRDTDRWRALRDAGMDRDAAVAELRRDEAFMDSLKTAKTRLEVGLLSMDPKTGFVKAWVGGADFVADKYDHVYNAKRQPGSTFKPFVYTAAIDNGYSPYYEVLDSPFSWYDEGSQTTWAPKNSGGTTDEYLSLKRALAESRNIPTARVTQLVTPQRVATYAKRMGIKSDIAAVPSIGLGVTDVSLFELVGAYGTLAAGGVYHEPQFVERITDRDGNTIAEFGPEEREALSPNTAYTVVDMMRGVIDGGGMATGSRIRWKFGIADYDFAGKTGTTQESADGWFMLMHPDLVTGAWVGFNDRRIAFRTSWWGQGAHNALHVVGDYMKRVTTAADPSVRLSKSRRFTPPPGYVPPDVPPPTIDPEDRPAGALLERWRNRLRGEDEDGEAEEREDRRERRGGRIGW